MEDFYLTLPSNASMIEYPENKTSEYTVKLPCNINLSENFKVGISEIHYAHNFYNVSENNQSLIFYHENNVVFQLILNIGIYPSIEQIVKSFNHLVNECSFISIEKPLFSFDYSNERVKVNIKQLWIDNLNEYEKLSDINIFTFGKLQCTKNFEFLKNHKSNRLAITKISLENRLSVQLGFPLGSNVLKYQISPLPTHIEFGLPNQFFIYCDVIDYQLVGNTYAKIIKIVTVDKNISFGFTSTKSFHPIQYVPLAQKTFDQITIHIKDTEGKFIPFLYGTFIITLHFTKLLSNQNAK